MIDDKSLLQNTVLRCHAHADASEPVLVSNEEHRFLVAEQLRQLEVKPEAMLLEPAARNTAPAVAIGVLQALEVDEDAVVVVLPSDHVIPEEVAFQNALSDAIALASESYLVTFGVTPLHPETGYGYIRAGKALDAPRLLSDCALVDRFVEKPDVDTAERYLAEGDYYWNSGMFVFKAARYLEELEKYRSDIASAARDAFNGRKQDIDFTRVDEAAFRKCPSESIDYAVMEHTEMAAVVPLNAGWSDIGSWDALWQASDRNENGNALVGDVIAENVENSYVRAEHRLVSVVGISDVVVVETADAVLIASQEEAQQVKSIVNNLKSCDRDERISHRKVYRPWGYYEGIDAGENFQVKRITVSPGASLSLQRHAKRAEHWVVVNGVATVTKDEDVFQLKANESTYIPIGCKHRLQNMQAEPLEIIEVQSGSYLGEDDIERFDDVYGRSS